MVKNQNYETIKKFLIALGFENIESSRNRFSWIHREKSIDYHLDPNNNGIDIFKDSIKKFLRLIKENFSSIELNDLLTPLLKENKIRFKKIGKSKILRIEPIEEKNLDSRILFHFLPEKTKKFYFDYNTPLEFNEELKNRIENKFSENLEKEIEIQTHFTK